MCTKGVIIAQEFSKLSDFGLFGKIDRYLEKKRFEIFRKRLNSQVFFQMRLEIYYCSLCSEDV